MALVRPRLTDHFRVSLTQEEADFAIPFLDEDIPLCVDPFLLWKSPSQQDQALHTHLITAFNHLGWLVRQGQGDKAHEVLVTASECEEVAMGFSATRKGSRIGSKASSKILALFEEIPQIAATGFAHLEEVQFYVDQIGRDRISDITCSFIKSWLIDYTIDRCLAHGIPTNDVVVEAVYSAHQQRFSSENVKLPVNPATGKPTILVPKRWLRAVPWINHDQYVTEYVQLRPDGAALAADRIKLLTFNRHNYDLVQAYVKERERVQEDCKNDPLFTPIPILSAKRKIQSLSRIPPGNEDSADKDYEAVIVQLLASMLYPHLDFAQAQSRTESGVLIRDLIFYNNRKIDFLDDIYKQYGSQQLVFEMKNVREVSREHINQLNRYLSDSLGRFGVLVTRQSLPKTIIKNTVDLWAGQRKCIIALTDEDVRLMADVFESKQRAPLDILKARYIGFIRSCPA